MISDHVYNQLCQYVQEKNKDGLIEVYDRYGDAIYGLIIRIVLSEEVAKELLQDTFMKVWEKGHTYDPNLGRLYTWMARIARNEAINYIHSKAYKATMVIQDDENLVYLNDDSRQASSIEACDLNGALMEIEVKYRKVIELIYYKGRTHQEVSNLLDIPLGTVKSRVKIGIRQLRKIYNYGLSSVLVFFLALPSII